MKPSNIKSVGMEVIKRNGESESVHFDKILNRVNVLINRCGLKRIDAVPVVQETISGLYNRITTEEIDKLTAIQCADRMREDTEYDKLAVGLCVSRLHKMTSDDFYEVTKSLREINTESNQIVSDRYFEFVTEHKETIQKKLNYSNDYNFDYFGFKTLEKAYLHRKYDEDKKAKIIERPQHMWMRVAVGLNLDSIDDAMETYEGLSSMCFIFGSPTLFNSGSSKNQMSSCFLLKMEDSIEGIYDTIKDTALISKRAGGIGISMSDIRASGSMIRGTNGMSNGPVPFIQELNYTGRAVNQGGRRNGSIAIYIEPWHADIFHFCELRSNKGSESQRARDIFLALWIPDLFMKRVQSDGYWSLMCPDECKGLTQTYGDEFEKLYEKYEAEGRYRKRIKAFKLWEHILVNQTETGMPYMLYKDHVNHKTNHKNLGTIQSSNLCTEIVEYTDVNETAVCNLSSLCLPKFIRFDNDGKPVFDFERLQYIAGLAIKNLNKVIDINYYPIEKARRSNFRHRPVGLGVQGLSDVYCIFGYPYNSPEANTLNKQIFETIYYGSLMMSMKLAKLNGPYSTFEGSPFSKGELQFHMWGLKEEDLLMGYDWKRLREDIMEHGTRNSLLTTVMPTASTSQIMGNFESIEPITSNVYTRTTQAGEYTVINKHLVNKLLELGLWNEDIRNELLYDNGSVQKIKEIPKDVKEVYKTAFELGNRAIVKQSIDRGPFIDQSQSLNLFCKEPDRIALTTCHFYGWTNKIKTGMYYLRTQPASNAIKFGLDVDVIDEIVRKRNDSNKKKEKTHHIEFQEACAGGSCSA